MLFQMRYNVLFRQFRLLTAQAGSVPAAIRLIFENCYTSTDKPENFFSFYRIPKALFQEPRFQNLSTDAKTLYGILLDRMSLSAKNGWLDEQGRVFIIFTIEDVKRALC